MTKFEQITTQNTLKYLKTCSADLLNPPQYLGYSKKVSLRVRSPWLPGCWLRKKKAHKVGRKMDGFRHSLQLHKYPRFKLFLLWYYLVVGESRFLGGRITSAQPSSMVGRRRAVKLGLSRPWNICQAVCLYFIAWRCIEWNPHRGHSTTTWTKFYPILTPSPHPPVNYCGHSAAHHRTPLFLST